MGACRERLSARGSIPGTSATVYPAAGLVGVAREAGARVVIVNLEPTPMNELAHAVFYARVAQILPQPL